MTTAGYDYTVELQSSNDAVISTLSFEMSAASMSTTLDVGGAGNPFISVKGTGDTMLLAVATGSTTSLKSAEVPLSVVEDYLKADFSLTEGTNTGKFFNINLKDSADAAVTATSATVTHVTKGIGSMPVETVPSIATDANGDVAFYFAEPTGTVTTAGNEYYLVSHAGYGDALYTDNNMTADIVIPSMPEMQDSPILDGHIEGVTGGVSKQDGVFTNFFSLVSTTTGALVSETDNLNIMMAIKPATEHVGLKVSKVIFAAYADLFNTFGIGDTVLMWNVGPAGRLNFVPYVDTLIPYQTDKLLTSETEAFHIFSGPLTGAPGLYLFFAGYILPDGTVVFNSQEIGQVVVNPVN